MALQSLMQVPDCWFLIIFSAVGSGNPLAWSLLLVEIEDILF